MILGPWRKIDENKKKIFIDPTDEKMYFHSQKKLRRTQKRRAPIGCRGSIFIDTIISKKVGLRNFRI
jgi:hypothetical protein